MFDYILGIKQITQKLKDLVKLQAYYFERNNLKRCSAIAERIDQLMLEKERLFEDAPTQTNWYYDFDGTVAESLEMK